MNRLARFAIALAAGFAALASAESVSQQRAPEPVSVARGRDIYQHHCIGCHAVHGTGDSFLAVPALAGQRPEYLRRQIERFSLDQRHSSRMRWAFNQVSMNTPEAAIDVATYLSQLPAPKVAEGDSRFQAQGKASFIAHCAACHGKNALGNADGTVPSLRAQHDSYLVNRLRQFASARPAVEIGAHALDDHLIIAISAYLSSLQGSGVQTSVRE